MQGRRGLTEFAVELLQGVLAHRDEMDELLTEMSTHWKLARMPVVDRNVLRLGAYEITHAETPGRVAVNEAIVLAKRYGDAASPRFVNGVLDRLLKESANRSA
jgi:transcription antitermination protein NusB